MLTTGNDMNRTQDAKPQDIGPESVSLHGVSSSFQGLWRLSGTVPPPHQNNLIVVTEVGNLMRIQQVLNALPADCAARQAIVLTGTAPRPEVNVSLVSIAGLYVERLEVYPGYIFLPDMLGALVHPAMTNHIWWACEHVPETDALRALAHLADQLILDTLTDMPTLVDGTLSDLSWERTAPWRSVVARTLDAPDHRIVLPDLERAVVRYAAGDARPARLFAAWLMDHLNWEDASRVQLAAVHSERGAGDLDGLELIGPGSFGLWDAGISDVRVRLNAADVSQDRVLPLLPGSLADGLAALLTGPRKSSQQLLRLARSVTT